MSMLDRALAPFRSKSAPTIEQLRAAVVAADEAIADADAGREAAEAERDRLVLADDTAYARAEQKVSAAASALHRARLARKEIANKLSDAERAALLADLEREADEARALVTRLDRFAVERWPALVEEIREGIRLQRHAYLQVETINAKRRAAGLPNLDVTVRGDALVEVVIPTAIDGTAREIVTARRLWVHGEKPGDDVGSEAA